MARARPETIVEPSARRRPFGNHRRRRAALHNVSQGPAGDRDCAGLEDRKDHLGIQLRRALPAQNGYVLWRRAALDAAWLGRPDHLHWLYRQAVLPGKTDGTKALGP